MDVEKILSLIILIIGKEAVTKEMKGQLKTLLSLVMKTDYQANEYKTLKATSTVRKKNEIDLNSKDDIPLSESTFFNIPKGELNVEIEGESEPRKVMITPGGVPIN